MQAKSFFQTNKTNVNAHSLMMHDHANSSTSTQLMQIASHMNTVRYHTQKSNYTQYSSKQQRIQARSKHDATHNKHVAIEACI